ncbi:hypothetical protein K432DRAFT_392176 [Lepidopterella palustris CBS 459.81]|uniref:Uncharacterized protein n=1 Tax=Lepidopterella palustris CBS 459.81 TaxID=1314670 RepID=A0A8E2JGS9_9PEZI|nr:hypothetical protein K432DRAFT_392176 [Lepidopterella palustris CBS 459.81]
MAQRTGLADRLTDGARHRASPREKDDPCVRKTPNEPLLDSLRWPECTDCLSRSLSVPIPFNSLLGACLFILSALCQFDSPDFTRSVSRSIIPTFAVDVTNTNCLQATGSFTNGFGSTCSSPTKYNLLKNTITVRVSLLN